MDHGITTGFLPRTNLDELAAVPVAGLDGVRTVEVTPELLGRVVIPFETFGGLVQNQKDRIGYKPHGELQPLLLSAG